MRLMIFINLTQYTRKSNTCSYYGNREISALRLCGSFVVYREILYFFRAATMSSAA